MALLITLIAFVLLLVGIKKKVNLNLLLFTETIALLLYIVVVNGSLLGENGTGNAFLDCFKYIANSLSTNIGGTVFSMILVSAYVAVMKYIQATDMLASIFSKGIGKISSKYFVMALFILVSGLLRTCITSGPAAVILLLATFFPVMLRVGCSLESACAVLLVSNAICWGPADPITLAAANLMGIEVNPAEWFITCQLPIFFIIFAVAIPVFMIVTRLSEKNVNCVSENVVVGDELNAPKFYAVLPVIPLILMLIFSPFAVSSIHMDINTACILSLVITLLVMIFDKDNSPSKVLTEFCTAFGNELKGLGLTVMFAMLFASSLNAVGGMKTISDMLMQLKVPAIVLVLLVCAFGGIINVVVGSFLGALALAQPLAGVVAAATGIHAPLMCFLVIISCGAGCICSPVNPMVLILSEKMPVGKLIKRVALPIWSGVLVAILIGYFVFA